MQSASQGKENGFHAERQRGQTEGKDVFSAMEQARWEFLVISSDIAAYKTITRTVAKTNPVVDYTSGIATARAFIARRKIDGIFLDMELLGSLDLVQDIRRGGSNRFSVIFACAAQNEDASVLLGAGVNFVLYKPLVTNVVLDALDSASPMIMAERKRYLRYQLMVPVVLRLREQEQQAVTANVSRGGMAVRCQRVYEPGSPVQFDFDVPGAKINGQGEVAWTNTEGFMGIKFHLLGEQNRQALSSWLDKQGPRLN
jgi:CheY-like chemotaxis protein